MLNANAGENGKEKDFRMEKDFLGQKEVPLDAYYGIQTCRAVENFPITGLHVHPRLIYALATVKKAAAYANLKTHRLDEKIARAIIRAAGDVLNGKLDHEFVVDPIQGGAGTSINMNINEVIANRAIEYLGGAKGDYSIVSPNTHVNMGQSTNDVLPTAVHITILWLYKDLNNAIDELIAAFEKKGQEYARVIKVGRTHLQDAIPISFGQVFFAYASALRRAGHFLSYVMESLHEVTIGGTAIGTGLNTSMAYQKLVLNELRKLSGLPLVHPADLIDSTQNMDCLLRVSGELKALALVLSKIANDLRMMNSGPRAGIKEISLPDVQPGSSIMPGKVNPVIAEVLNQVAFQVVGNDATITMVAEAGQFELNVMQPVAVFNLLQTIDILTNVIRVFAGRAVAGIQVCAENCRKMVANDVSLATALVPVIGYEKASVIARQALQNKKSVGEVLAENKKMSPQVVKDILQPEKMICVKK